MRLLSFYSWLLLKTPQNTAKNSAKDSGFTLIELLVVMIIIGILSSIALPSFLSFNLNQKLNSAQSEIFRAIQEAQTTAKTTQTGYQVSFRADPATESLQYVINSVNSVPTVANPAYWNSLPWKTVFQDSSSPIIAMRGVSVSPAVTSATLNYPDAGSSPTEESSSTAYVVRRFRFDPKGGIDGGLLNQYVVLRVTKTTPTNARRCITITTILGATRTLSEGQSACPSGD